MCGWGAAPCGIILMDDLDVFAGDPGTHQDPKKDDAVTQTPRRQKGMLNTSAAGL